ncbi:hypothetical protein BDK51DRAFT_53189 [Blyttiomyces helicus]|uniref:BRCT domain-containing protein n=1 Tax=Blyttiomyces helicus TaxID=388810 RepID=A0A4P9VWN0_9FUNG|nr:hypothetical protein BDK51DRAFT_53189 [Blyttiomyces helicus]|eukprot:RKO83265.1 hypothetical protein BDK51DRAFT_53189 [Blyttiomyces helicus]
MLRTILNFLWRLGADTPPGNGNGALFRGLSFCTGGMDDCDAERDLKDIVARYGGHTSARIRHETSYLILDLFTDLVEIPSSTQLAILVRIAHTAGIPVVRESFVW